MATDVRYGQGVTLRFDPPARWASPTGLVLDPAGASVETPTPSVNSYSSTVATATEEDAFTVADATGLSKGDLIEVADDDWGTALALVSYVNGVTVGLVESLPGVPAVSSTVLGADVSLAVASIASRGKGYRAIVRNGNEELTEVLNVVFSPFSNPITARRVREYVQNWWPNDPIMTDELDLQRVADRAGLRLRTRMMASRIYPHTVWDADGFIEPGEIAMKIELADRNLIPGDQDAAFYGRDLLRELSSLVNDLLSGATARDEDEDNALSVAEASGITYGRFTR